LPRASGNVLEWYDFAIYGYFAAAIGRQFFPHQDPALKAGLWTRVNALN
jgi:hypothetical protein